MPYDICINFSPNDNVPTATNYGWVSFFVRFLDTVLSEMAGRPIAIAFDENNTLPDEAFLDVKVLVNIVSLSFVEDKVCMKRLEDFATYLDKRAEKKNHIFKIIKEPIGKKEHIGILGELHGLLNYHFYHETTSGDYEYYSPYYQTEGDNLFSLQVLDVCDDIYAVLQPNIASATLSAGMLTYVYLGDVGKDLQIEKAILKRELKRHGYGVLPDKAYPHDVTDATHWIESQMKRAVLSVHLLANDYGRILRGDKISLTELEIQVSASRLLNTENTFSQMIWIAPWANPTNQYQQNLLESVKKLAIEKSQAEVHQTRIQEFKNTLLSYLQPRESDAEQRIFSSPKKPEIYLQFDKTDADWTKQVQQFLQLQGIETCTIPVTSSAVNSRATHRILLNECSATVILYENATTTWLVAKLQDTLKAPGLGRRADTLPIGVLVRNPNERDVALKIRQQFKHYQEIVVMCQTESVVTFWKQLNIKTDSPKS